MPPVVPRLSLESPPSMPPAVVDDAARAILDELASAGPDLMVLGAPGSGRTTLAVEAVVEAAAADRSVVLLTPARRVAGRLRDVVARRLGAHDDRVRVSTPAAFSFGLLAQHAAYWGGPAPALLSGADEDGMLAELLAGHAEGVLQPPGWPDTISAEALGLDAFRHELRDILARAGELDLQPEDLRGLAARHRRPEWAAVATVLEQFWGGIEGQDLADEQRPDAFGAPPRRHRRYDAARIVDEAAVVLSSWDVPATGEGGADQPVPETPRWDLVVVDDYQDVTRSTARLLRVLARDGARLLLLGDPDVAAQTFRGGSPTLVTEALDPFPAGGLGAETRLLPHVHRGTTPVRALVAALTERLPAGGPGLARRRAGPVAARGGPAPEVRTVGTAAQEADVVADTIRRAHLVDGLPYRECAVLVRTSGQAAALRSLLDARRVPVSPGRIGALRDEPAVRPLLLAVRAAAEGPTGESLRDLLLSPLGGADAVGLRRLMRVLRGAAEARGEAVDSDSVLLRAALAVEQEGAGGLPAGVPEVLTDPLLRVVRVLGATVRALDPDQGPVAVLWAAWDASGLAAPWQQWAIDGGPGSARAHADLDAVLALFYAAERHQDRGSPGGTLGLVARVESQRVAEDTLAAQSGRRDLVEVLTPAQAAGQEWELVVVAGLQEDVWPDLRRRDTILGSQALVDVVTGRGTGTDRWVEARKEVRDDEFRQLVLAVSRATGRLLVTAVDGADSRPSLFHELLARDAQEIAARPGADAGAGGGIDAHAEGDAVGGGAVGGDRGAGEVAGDARTAAAGTPVAARAPGAGGDTAVRRDREELVARDLRELVGRLRHAVVHDPQDRDAVRVLAHLAADGIEGADPELWQLAQGPTTDVPLRTDDEPVHVGPSSVESVTTCAMRWALTRFGGRGADSAAQSLGTLIHEIAEQHPHGPTETLQDALAARIEELDLGEGLAADQQRARAERLVEKLGQYVSTPADVRTEQEVDVVVGEARVRGQIDRLERQPDGSVLIVDLKTGKAISQQDALENPQMGTYQVALQELHRRGELDGPPAGARLVYLGQDTKSVSTRDQAPIGDTEDTWAHEKLREAVGEMTGASVRVRTNTYCSFCEVRTSCPLRVEGGRLGRAAPAGRGTATVDRPPAAATPGPAPDGEGAAPTDRGAPPAGGAAATTEDHA